MISTKAMRVWTQFGYLFVDDLYLGEKVISFNPKRGVCEYDTVEGIEVTQGRCMGYGVQVKTMRQVVTPDHPIQMWNNKTKELSLFPIQDKFMVGMNTRYSTGILSNALFEPYRRSQEEEDIRWSARMAASIANHPRAKLNIKDIVSDLGGYEAQIWLDTFFHWNIMVPMSRSMATVKVSNAEVRNAVFNIAPRAGVGVKSYVFRGKRLLSIPEDGIVHPKKNLGWFKQSIDEPMFNLTTKNGNVLVRSSMGSFLIACNRQENDVKTM